MVLVEKQDIVEKLANSVAWLKQAEDHMNQQTSIGNDFSQVQSQYLAHKVKDVCILNYILHAYIATACIQSYKVTCFSSKVQLLQQNKHVNI